MLGNSQVKTSQEEYNALIMSEQLTPYTKERYPEDTMPELGESRSWGGTSTLERDERDDRQERERERKPQRLTSEQKRIQREYEKHQRRTGDSGHESKTKEWTPTDWHEEQSRREKRIGHIPRDIIENFGFFDKATQLDLAELSMWHNDSSDTDYDGEDPLEIKKLMDELAKAEDDEGILRLFQERGRLRQVFEEIDRLLKAKNKGNKDEERNEEDNRPRVQKAVPDTHQRRIEYLRRVTSIQKALSERNFNEAKDQTYRLTDYLKELRGGLENQKIDVRSIEDLAELIIETDPELWQEKFPLLENGRINQANFLNWIRESMMWHDGNDSDNPSLQLMGLIELTTPYKSFNLAGMLRNRGKFFRTRDGVDLDELREQITREVWLFNTARNDDLKYKLKMSSDTDMTNQIKEMFYVNTFTKNAFGKSTMRWIMTMPERFKPSYEQRTDLTQEAKKADANVGEATRTAFMIYYHIADYKRLQEILGDDSPLMSREAYEDYIIDKELDALKEEMKSQGENVMDEDELKRKGMRLDTKYMEKRKERKDIVTDLIKNQSRSEASKEIQARWLGTKEGGDPYLLDLIFGRDGKINPTNFIDFINFFKGPETTLQTINTVRAMIRQSIDKLYPEYIKDKATDVTKKLEDWKQDLKEARDAGRTDEAKRIEKIISQSTRDQEFGVSKYAERWAHSMLRWTGAAARNDTGARAYDKWTELQLLREKRDRDSQDRRVSAYGNPYTFNLYKSLSPDLLTGLVIQKDKKTSPYQLLWEIEKKRIAASDPRDRGYDIHNELQDLEFTDNAMGQFAAVQIANAVQLLEAITGAKELNFDKMGSIDKYGRLVFNEADVQDELKSFFKNFRNAYSTWSQINFSTQVRALVDNKTDPPTYEDKSLAEVMFGDEILDIKEFHGENGRFDAKVMMRHKRHRDLLWKQLAKGFIAAQIRAHRDLDSNYTQYDYHQLHILYETLEKIPGQILFLKPQESERRKLEEEYLKAKEEAEEAYRSGDIEKSDKLYEAVEKIQAEIEADKEKAAKKEQGRINRENKKGKFRKEFEKRFGIKYHDSPERTILEIQTAGKAFTHADIAWIREHSGTAGWKVNLGEYTGTFFSAGWEGIKGLFSVISNSLKN